jgi:hypothetical protein
VAEISQRLSAQEATQRLVALHCRMEGKYPGDTGRRDFICNLCDRQFKSSLAYLFSSKNRDENEPACNECCKKHRSASREAHRLKKLREIVSSHGGELISNSLPRYKARVTVRCNKNHEWSVIAQSVLSGSWCPECSPSFPRTLKELEEIVQSRGGRLISKEYKGVDATYVMECSLGHQFRNMFKKIESGQWCPTCSKGKISEEIARTTFEQIFRVRFYKERPQWLRNSRGRQMELDGANLTLGLAFEYQGAQHFSIATHYIKTDEALNQRRIDDEMKIQLCTKHRIHLVVLTNEMDKKDYPTEIQRQLQISGFDTSGFDFNLEIDMAKAYVRQDRLIALRDLLASKKITLISSAWMGVNEKYELRCDVCETEFMAKGSSFFNRRRVSGCDFCNRSNQGEKFKLGIDSLHEFASRFGGELLSDTYVQRRWNYKWKCSSGHEFEGNFNNMVFRNQFCPECEKRATKTKGSLQLLQYFAKQHNGELLSKEFLKTSSKYSWKCVKGHEFKRTYDYMLQASNFCTECGKDVPRYEKKKTERFLELSQFAVQHGGRVLETEYHGRDYKYAWQCAQGHEFIRNYSDMKFRNRFCWFCDGTK